jgi:hypothetical protein
VIWVEAFTVKLVEARPPNLPDVVPVRLVPEIVTEVPTGPLVGEKELIVGGGEIGTVKLSVLVAVPPGVVERPQQDPRSCARTAARVRSRRVDGGPGRLSTYSNPQHPDQERGKKLVIGRVQEQAESPSSGSPQASSIVRRIEYKS